MPTNHRITLLTASGEVEGLLLQHDVKWNEGRPNCQLELTAMGRTIAAEGIDWFEALIGIRQKIEPEGLRLNVYGASRNVWPSGMCRNMGMGLKAYKMQIGKQAEKPSRVRNLLRTRIPRMNGAQTSCFAPLAWLRCSASSSPRRAD